MSEDIFVWSEPVRVAEAIRHTARDPLIRHLSAEPAVRARLAKALDLVALEALEADLALSAWFDGLQIDARWSARVTQTCGVTLEAFSSDLGGAFQLRLVPPSSPHAPVDPVEEIVIEPDAEDPPDLLEGDTIDLGVYLIEHLALEIDPFPRKPDAVFEPPTPNAEISPFAVLRALKKDGDPDPQGGRR